MAAIGYGLKTTLQADPATAEAAIREALADRGFGVLTEIDVAATMKAKLDLDIPPYRILGACNPHLASNALELEPDVGLLLPCNVVVYADGDDTVVAALDPETMVDVTENADLAGVAREARRLLSEAIAQLG